MCNRKKIMIAIDKLKKHTVILVISVLAFCIEGYSQHAKDTTIYADNYSKYIGLSCTLREDLIKSVKSGDTLTIKRFQNTTLAFSMSEEQTIKSRLLTVRENQMLEFYNSDYYKLLSDLKTGQDYFLSSKKMEKGYYYPNFECGNLTLGVINFWKSNSDSILDNIEQSDLTTSEKELLTLYWEAVLLYIEGEKTLALSINKKAKEYLEKHPDSQYKTFLERLIGIKRIYQPNAMSLGLGIGKSNLTGNVNSYLQGNITFDFEVGYTIKNWHFRLGYRLHGFNYRDTLRLSRIDNLEINQSSSIEYHGATLRVGYTVFEKGRFKIQPFLSGELNKLVNYINIPDSTVTRQSGKTHPILGIGTEGSIRLTKNLIRNEQAGYLYYPREEKDISYNPVFLSFRVGYYHNVFENTTNISGNILYSTLGLEWIIGKNKVDYRYKK